MSRPSITAVIPAYNCARYVGQAIESALAQTRPPDEIIVVDDGSTDDTKQRIQAYGERVRYFHQPNQGVSAARNQGLALARGDLIAFLDADDVWHPQKLEIQVKIFAERPLLGLLSTLEFSWPAITYPTLQCHAPKVTVIPWDSLAVRNYLATSAILARKHILDQAGPFDSSLQGPEDRDLWLRVAAIAPVAVLNVPLTGYRDVPGSVSKNAIRCQSSMLRILQKLDSRSAWKGRALLRRKSYGYTYHSCAYIHASAGNYGTAVLNSLRSFWWYPFPFRYEEMSTFAERPKRLVVNLMRCVGIMRQLGRSDAPATENDPNPLLAPTGSHALQAVE